MKSTKSSNSVLIVAAEASSVVYAKRILEGWRDQGFEVDAFGVGDQSMVDVGFRALGRSEKMSVVGIWEVLPRYLEFRAKLYEILEECERVKPKFALLLDYPGFNLRLAKRLHKMNVPVVYYISPQIWAWKKGRIQDMKKFVSKVLTIFPFENRFYEEHNVPVEFVGHPLLDELKTMGRDGESCEEDRKRFGISDGQRVLGLMPGSRRSELKYNLDVQLQTARRMKQEDENLRVVLMVAPGLEKEIIDEALSAAQFPVTVMQSEPFKMIRLADVVLCASGTATLMVGLMNKPMVIMYRMNPLTAFMAKILVGKKRFGMVNLIMEEDVAPEFFQEEANPENLAAALFQLLRDENLYLDVRQRLEKLQPLLGSTGANHRVLQALTPYFEG